MRKESLEHWATCKLLFIYVGLNYAPAVHVFLVKNQMAFIPSWCFLSLLENEAMNARNYCHSICTQLCWWSHSSKDEVNCKAIGQGSHGEAHKRNAIHS